MERTPAKHLQNKESRRLTNRFIDTLDTKPKRPAGV